jgi:hypothetical protein
VNRNQARTQARQEAQAAHGLRRAADKLWTSGQRAEAQVLYTQALTHDGLCDELCSIAAGTKKVLDVAPQRDTGSRVAPDDF